MNRRVAIDDAVGLVLAHDVTEIRPGEFKGPAFRKGWVVRPEDIDHLRRLGKEHLFVLEIGEDELHENDAVISLAGALCGENVAPLGEASEGKLKLVATSDGLLEVDVQALLEFNMLAEVMCATRHTHTPVKRGDELAGTRAIPLVIKRDVVERAVDIASKVGGILEVKPFASRKVGVVITGNEVFHGIIEDRFESIVREKVQALGSRVAGVGFAPDDTDHISRLIGDLLAQGADFIVTTGGMSVDPDDVTRKGIAEAGASAILYGSPVLPGAMFLLADIGGVPVVGVPACALYHQNTIFDLVFPRLLAGETIDRRDLAAMGHGGLCLNCAECRFPDCAFGKNG